MESAEKYNLFRQLQWACRRGMLELDVLLGNFLNSYYESLSLAERKCFAELLNEPDPLLFGWLMGHDQPQRVDFLHLIEKIRQHAKSQLPT